MTHIQSSMCTSRTLYMRHGLCESQTTCAGGEHVGNAVVEASHLYIYDYIVRDEYT